MWNPEGTERLVLRMLPIAFVVVIILLALMTLQLQPRQLSRAFETPPAVFVQQAE